MNKKLLMVTLIPLALLMMVTPVMAKPIGPQKAVGKNPHLIPTPEGVEALLPSGGVHSWMADTELMAIDIMHCLDASKAKGLANKAITIAMDDLEGWMMLIMFEPEAALEALKNKWFYLPYDTLVLMFTLEGLSPEEAAAMASMWPEGMYCRFVNVGPTWDA